MRRITALAFAVLLFATPVRAAISYITRSQNNNSTSASNLVLTVPATAVANDLLLSFVESYDYNTVCPSQWIQLANTGCSSSGNTFFLNVCYRFATAGDPGSTYTWLNLAYSKGIIRVERGVDSGRPFRAVSGADATCVSIGAGLTIPALLPTGEPGDFYVGYWENAGATTTTGPGDLADTTADTTQWSTFEGDKTISLAGITPVAEAATGSSAVPWLGFAMTLRPSTSTIAPQQWGAASMPSTVCVPANCTNTTSSLATLQTNLTAASAGQQICFTGSGTLASDLTFGASGTAGNPISLCCMPGSTITGSTVNGINLSGRSYTSVYGCAESGATDSGIVTSGASSHHTIEYNTISGNGAGGIAINNSDYDIIEHNSVYGNAGTNASSFSGISLYEPIAFDSGAGIHNQIAYNASFSNLNPSGGTDGNGIILDTFSSNAYTGETVVHDNVNWLNNGACVKVYSAGVGAQNVIVSNDCYHNWQGNWSGTYRHEIEYELSADNPLIANNLLVPDPSILNNSGTGVMYDGGSGTPVIGNNVGGGVNFFFLEPPADLRELFGGSSIRAGVTTISSTPVYVPPLDAQGVPRPSAFDAGAYQYRGSVFSQP